jgi:two-component system, NarL family, response regulator NreC
MKKIRIAIVDDHDLVRDGICALLKNAKNIQIVYTLSSPLALLENLEKESVDVVLLDVSMPEMSGIELAKIIQEKYPSINIIILSMHKDEEFIYKAIKSGAKSYLPKNTSKEELLEAITTVAENKIFYNKEISQIMLEAYVNQLTKPEEKEKISLLTNREIEVLSLFSEGKTNKEIAEELSISIRTVETHKTNMMQKLKVKTTVDLFKFAMSNDIVKP